MAALPLAVEADSGAGWISPPTAQDWKHRDVVFPSLRQGWWEMWQWEESRGNRHVLKPWWRQGEGRMADSHCRKCGDRIRAGQQLENKQIHNLRKCNFPGHRAKFFQALIPFTSLRENNCSHWNVGFPLLNYNSVHSNIWPMSPWPHQEQLHSLCHSWLAALARQDFQIWDRQVLLHDLHFGTCRRTSFPSSLSHHWNSP